MRPTQQTNIRTHFHLICVIYFLSVSCTSIGFFAVTYFGQYIVLKSWGNIDNFSAFIKIQHKNCSKAFGNGWISKACDWSVSVCACDKWHLMKQQNHSYETVQSRVNSFTSPHGFLQNKLPKKTWAKKLHKLVIVSQVIPLSHIVCRNKTNRTHHQQSLCTRTRAHFKLIVNKSARCSTMPNVWTKYYTLIKVVCWFKRLLFFCRGRRWIYGGKWPV